MEPESSPSKPGALPEEHYRREAIGAFAHEIRTPLTSIRMVMELARRQGVDGQMLLDQELAEMLTSSVDDLESLADDLQETARLERGKLVVSYGPCDLAAAVDAASELLEGRVGIDGPRPETMHGPWDPERTARALAGFAMAANRMGDGRGSVSFCATRSIKTADLVFESGERNAGTRQPAADAGFSFFRSRQLVNAMGGSVECIRGERYARIEVYLPWHRGEV